jgi:choline dehydrogenase
VVGGGAAGCVAAARLSEDERRVCLLQGGTDYGPYDEGRWPADALDGRLLALAHVWPPVDDDRSKLRPRIIGGGSSVNACMLALGAPPDYDWGGGWTYESLRPFADRALEALGARRLEHSELGTWHARLLAAGLDADLDARPNLVNMRWRSAPRPSRRRDGLGAGPGRRSDDDRPGDRARAEQPRAR